MITANVARFYLKRQKSSCFFLFCAWVIPMLVSIFFISSLSLVLMLPTEALAAPKGAMVYRWVDSDGNVRYSDRMPPDQADLGHSEIAPTTGIVQRNIPRAKTAEQLARELSEKQEKDRLAKIERAQKEEERNLLRRYRDLDAIERDMSLQLERIDAEIRTVEARIVSIRASIADLHQRAANLERNQSSPPQDLYTRMDGLEKEILEHQSVVVTKQESRKEVEAQFNDYRAQFVKIMGLPTTDSKQ